MANEIPAAELTLIDARDYGRCARCGGRGGARHHRRRRRVADTHTHQPCNVVTLCLTCHSDVHAHPTMAKEQGWILKPWTTDPHREAVRHYLYGWVWLQCDGTFVLLGECEGCESITLLEGGLCMACLRTEVCHSSPVSAAVAMCGCGGVAATQMEKLIRRERQLA